MRFEIFKKKQKQEFDHFIKEKYGFDLPSCQIIKQSTDKLRIFTGNLSEHELSVLSGTVRVETAGLYLATWDTTNEEKKQESIRLSFDASFLGKDATKNVLELDDEQVKQWFKGDDISLEKPSETQSLNTDSNHKLTFNQSITLTSTNELTNTLTSQEFILLKYKDEIVGCGKLAQNKILNFVPKERRIKY